MTVITKPKNGQKEQKAFLDDVESLGDTASVASAAPSQEGRRRLRIVNYLTLVLFFALVLVVLSFVLGHVVRRVYGPPYYRGFCRIPISRVLDDAFITEELTDNSIITGDFSGNNPVDGKEPLTPVIKSEVVGEDLTLMEKIKQDGTVEFDYELDLEMESFEEFQMPELSRGRYFHDFKVNQTAIIDPDGNRCFLLPLDRDEIPKPKTLYDLIANMRQGAYNLDIDEVREDTIVVFPPITNFDGYGMFIPLACKDSTSYRLRRLTEEEQESIVNVEKRSVDQARKNFDFIEFTGKKYVKYNILNLADTE